MSGSAGQTVNLTCTGDRYTFGILGVGWYQQVLGAAPKTVMIKNSRPSGIPARFSGSKSGNTASLTITGLQPEDEADYYCLTFDLSGNPTVLQPRGELRQKPALLPGSPHHACDR